MHRVYNSAFMHMLRDEDGAGYRKVIRETLEFDPEILKRYVNFMSNPDEKTAVEQFGKGDKYFGVATVLATLPGLPMLGHGQVEGFGEKYGMEFRRATLDERPDPDLVARHEREIFPLLHRRAWFAEAHDFLLYDFVTDGGAVDEHVFAYSNGTGPERSLVVYHDRFASTSGLDPRLGRLRAARRPTGPSGSSGARWRRAWACPTDPGAFVIFRDARTGLEYASVRAGRSGSTGSTCRSRPTAATSSGSSARCATAAPGSGRAWRRGSAGRPSPPSTRRCASSSSSPSTGPFRALFADGLIRGCPGRAGEPGAARRARATVRRVPGRHRRGDRRQRRPGRGGERQPGPGRRSPSRRCRRTMTGPNERRCSPGWP